MELMLDFDKLSDIILLITGFHAINMQNDFKDVTFSSVSNTLDTETLHRQHIEQQIEQVVEVLTEHINYFEDKTLIIEANNYTKQFTTSRLLKNNNHLLNILTNKDEIYSTVFNYHEKLNKENIQLSSIISYYEPILDKLSTDLSQVSDTSFYERTHQILSLHKLHLNNLKNKVIIYDETLYTLNKFINTTLPQLITHIIIEIKRGNLAPNANRKPAQPTVFKVLKIPFIITLTLLFLFIGFFTTGGFFLAFSALIVPMIGYGVYIFLCGLSILTDNDFSQDYNLYRLWQNAIFYSAAGVILKTIISVIYNEKSMVNEIMNWDLTFKIPTFGFDGVLIAYTFLLFGCLVAMTFFINFVRKKTKKIEEIGKSLKKDV